MSNNLLTEMYQILGYPHEVSMDPPKGDPTPHEVSGCFAVTTTLSPMDEFCLDTLGTMTWNSIMEWASFATLSPGDFNTLAMAARTDTRAFRDQWIELVSEGCIGEDIDKNVFFHAVRGSDPTDIPLRMSYWASRMIGAAGSSVQEAAGKKKKSLAGVFPGDNKKEHDKGVEAARDYLTPHDAGTDKPKASKEVMRPDFAKDGKDAGKERDKGIKAVKKAENDMTKAAKKLGKKPDEAFPNLWPDLARERARNS